MSVAVAQGSGFGSPGGAMIVRNPPGNRWLKRLVWPAYKFATDWLFDGYIERYAGRMIADCLNPGDAFLDVACGDMSVARYVPADTWYNAFDFQLVDFHLQRTLSRTRCANVAVASVEDIPLDDLSVDVLVCLQAFIHFPDFDKAAAELARVAKPGARLVCSISNNFANLYKVRGPHPDFTHDWTFTGFADDMARHGFSLVRGEMRGRWIPTPDWLTQRTLTLPIKRAEEQDNLIFFYIFEKK